MSDSDDSVSAAAVPASEQKHKSTALSKVARMAHPQRQSTASAAALAYETAAFSGTGAFKRGKNGRRVDLPLTPAMVLHSRDQTSPEALAAEAIAKQSLTASEKRGRSLRAAVSSASSHETRVRAIPLAQQRIDDTITRAKAAVIAKATGADAEAIVGGSTFIDVSTSSKKAVLVPQNTSPQFSMNGSELPAGATPTNANADGTSSADPKNISAGQQQFGASPQKQQNQQQSQQQQTVMSATGFVSNAAFQSPFSKPVLSESQARAKAKALTDAYAAQDAKERAARSFTPSATSSQKHGTKSKSGHSTIAANGGGGVRAASANVAGPRFIASTVGATALRTAPSNSGFAGTTLKSPGVQPTPGTGAGSQPASFPSVNATVSAAASAVAALGQARVVRMSVKEFQDKTGLESDGENTEDEELEDQFRGEPALLAEARAQRRRARQARRERRAQLRHAMPRNPGSPSSMTESWILKWITAYLSVQQRSRPLPNPAIQMAKVLPGLMHGQGEVADGPPPVNVRTAPVASIERYYMTSPDHAFAREVSQAFNLSRSSTGAVPIRPAVAALVSLAAPWSLVKFSHFLLTVMSTYNAPVSASDLTCILQVMERIKRGELGIGSHLDTDTSAPTGVSVELERKAACAAADACARSEAFLLSEIENARVKTGALHRPTPTPTSSSNGPTILRPGTAPPRSGKAAAAAAAAAASAGQKNGGDRPPRTTKAAVAAERKSALMAAAELTANSAISAAHVLQQEAASAPATAHPDVQGSPSSFSGKSAVLRTGKHDGRPEELPLASPTAALTNAMLAADSTVALADMNAVAATLDSDAAVQFEAESKHRKHEAAVVSAVKKWNARATAGTTAATFFPAPAPRPQSAAPTLRSSRSPQSSDQKRCTPAARSSIDVELTHTAQQSQPPSNQPTTDVPGMKGSATPGAVGPILIGTTSPGPQPMSQAPALVPRVILTAKFIDDEGAAVDDSGERSGTTSPRVVLTAKSVPTRTLSMGRENSRDAKTTPAERQKRLSRWSLMTRRSTSCSSSPARSPMLSENGQRPSDPGIRFPTKRAPEDGHMRPFAKYGLFPLSKSRRKMELSLQEQIDAAAGCGKGGGPGSAVGAGGIVVGRTAQSPKVKERLLMEQEAAEWEHAAHVALSADPGHLRDGASSPTQREGHTAAAGAGSHIVEGQGEDGLTFSASRRDGDDGSANASPIRHDSPTQSPGDFQGSPGKKNTHAPGHDHAGGRNVLSPPKLHAGGTKTALLRARNNFALRQAVEREEMIDERLHAKGAASGTVGSRGILSPQTTSASTVTGALSSMTADNDNSKSSTRNAPNLGVVKSALSTRGAAGAGKASARHFLKHVPGDSPSGMVDRVVVESTSYLRPPLEITAAHLAESPVPQSVDAMSQAKKNTSSLHKSAALNSSTSTTATTAAAVPMVHSTSLSTALRPSSAASVMSAHSPQHRPGSALSAGTAVSTSAGLGGRPASALSNSSLSSVSVRAAVADTAVAQAVLEASPFRAAQVGLLGPAQRAQQAQQQLSQQQKIGASSGAPSSSSGGASSGGVAAAAGSPSTQGNGGGGVNVAMASDIAAAQFDELRSRTALHNRRHLYSDSAHKTEPKSSKTPTDKPPVDAKDTPMGKDGAKDGEGRARVSITEEPTQSPAPGQSGRVPSAMQTPGDASPIAAGGERSALASPMSGQRRGTRPVTAPFSPKNPLSVAGGAGGAGAAGTQSPQASPTGAATAAASAKAPASGSGGAKSDPASTQQSQGAGGSAGQTGGASSPSGSPSGAAVGSGEKRRSVLGGGTKKSGLGGLHGDKVKEAELALKRDLSADAVLGTIAGRGATGTVRPGGDTDELVAFELYSELVTLREAAFADRHKPVLQWKDFRAALSKGKDYPVLSDLCEDVCAAGVL